MKYIMLQNEDGRNIPVIFPDRIVHADMAKYTQHLLMSENDEACQIISAGFVSLKASCSGKSETLGLSSKENDDMLIMFNDSIGSLDIDCLPPHVLQTLKDKM